VLLELILPLAVAVRSQVCRVLRLIFFACLKAESSGRRESIPASLEQFVLALLGGHIRIAWQRIVAGDLDQNSFFGLLSLVQSHVHHCASAEVARWGRNEDFLPLLVLRQLDHFSRLLPKLDRLRRGLLAGFIRFWH